MNTKLLSPFKKLSVLILFLGFGIALNAQLISVLNVTPPSSPTSCTNSSFDVLVQVNCNNFPFNQASFSVIGTTIFINVDYTSSFICTGALAFNSHTVNVGMLPGATYNVVVTTSLDGGGPTDTDNSTLTVASCCNAIPSFTASSLALCTAAQDSSHFTNTSTNVISQEWFVNNVLQSTNTNYSTFFSAPGVYDVKLKVQGTGCVDSTTQTVFVSQSPVVNLGPDIDTCVGSQVTLNAGSGQPIYAWSFGVANSPFLTVTASNTYSVTVTSANNCITRDTVVVTFHALPTVDLGPDAVVCAGSSLTLDAGNFSAYAWSTNESTQTISVSNAATYSVEVTDGFGCKNTDDIVLGLIASPVVDLGADTVAICAGNSATLDAGVHSSYLWNNTETTQSIDVTTSGMYSVSVSNAASCTAMDSTFIQVNALPIVALGLDTTVCNDLSVTLDAGSYPSIEWFDNSTMQTITLDSNTLNLGANTISVTVTDANGCDGSGSFVLTLVDCDTATVGIINQDLMEEISLYPNPGKDFLNLDFAKTFNALSIEIIDLNGRILSSEQHQQVSKVQMNIEALTTGIYFVVVRSDSKQAMLKLVKN